jgi:hypothetical protein
MTHLRLHIATSELGGDAPTEKTRITYQLSQFSDSYAEKNKEERRYLVKCVGFEGDDISRTDPFFKVGLLAMRMGRDLCGFLSWMDAEKDKEGQEIRKGTSCGHGGSVAVLWPTGYALNALRINGRRRSRWAR